MNQLQDSFNKFEIAVDDFINSDIEKMCNDEKYFIFQDTIEQVLNLFFRDRQVLDLVKSKPHAPILAMSTSEKIVGCYPPNGVIPIKKFSGLMAPLAYISNSHVDCYYIFRSFYSKYWCYLTSISSHPQSVLSLCKLFEQLLQQYEPEVCYHLNQLGINPLKTVFNWIVYCFMGVLDVDQVSIFSFLL